MIVQAFIAIRISTKYQMYASTDGVMVFQFFGNILVSVCTCRCWYHTGIVPFQKWHKVQYQYLRPCSTWTQNPCSGIKIDEKEKLCSRILLGHRKSEGYHLNIVNFRRKLL